jgi:UDP-glucuronate decarboxylase
LVGGKSTVITSSAVEDDPQRRKPDITRAMTYLNWKPKVYGVILWIYFGRKNLN